MFFPLIGIVLASAVPTPTGTADRCVAVYYDHQSAAAVSLAGSAAVGLYVATWRLTDGTLCGALAAAASGGVPVHVVYDGTTGTNDANFIATRTVVTSGGTVYAASFPRKIENNFITADGIYTLQGNYYYSPTAVQIGSYSAAVSGTNTAAVNVTTFNALISGGTITATTRWSDREQITSANPRLLAPLIELPGKRARAETAPPCAWTRSQNRDTGKQEHDAARRRRTYADGTNAATPPTAATTPDRRSNAAWQRHGPTPTPTPERDCPGILPRMHSSNPPHPAGTPIARRPRRPPRW
jgi:hypothetical protein